MKQIHTLTGLRGLAVLIVFISHCANERILPAYAVGFGQVGVMLFFVLSGFLMSYLYIHEDFQKENIKKYLLARIGRVFPLYFLILIFSIVITNFISSGSFYPFQFHDISESIKALLFIEAGFVFWTIPVEVQFYVVFLGFWALYKKGFSTYYLFAFVALTMIPAAVLYLLNEKLPQIVSSYSFAFFIGAATALLFEKIKHSPSLKRWANILGFPSLVLIFINLPELKFQYGLVLADGFFRTWGDPTTWIIVYILFICALLKSTSLGILNSRFFVYLGNISYGFYLIHYPILTYFAYKVDAGPIAKLILAFIVTGLISQGSLLYFEKPVSKKIRNFAKSKPD
jgi:peptidoglycan/LPS O-acetylase OafA/YrhL